MTEALPPASGDSSHPWHASSPEEVLGWLDASSDGLTSTEAAARLQRFGQNRLRLTPPESAWKILLAQFRSIVVGLLAAAAILSWLLGDPVDSVAILAVLLINTVLGFVTEFRARRAVEALGRLEVAQATALRDGETVTLPAAELVPGDVVLLEAGQNVPADLRLLTADDLQTAEAPLTGESLPVQKGWDSEAEADTPLADRVTMVYMSTAVVAGSGSGVVVATGPETEVGRIGEMTSRVESPRTPLEERLDDLGRRLVVAALGITAVVVLLGLLRGEPLGVMLETGVALAIAAVPEGLPAVATIALAVGVWRMAARKALVRRLPAVETLGSTTVVCTDKTGTLTAGEMTVTQIVTRERAFLVTGAGYASSGGIEASQPGAGVENDRALQVALETGVRANRAEVREADGTVEIVGDPTEAALIVVGRKGGIQRESLDRLPVESTIPFSSERRWMAVATGGGDGPRAWIKGAPEVLIEAATAWLDASGTARPMEPADREHFLELNRELASDGLRVLCAATGGSVAVDQLPADLCLSALFGLEDPPAAGVRETIEGFIRAGVRTLMITGDQPATAAAVARNLGMIAEGGEGVLTGRDLERDSPERLSAQLRNAVVLSRVEPADKLRVVEALQGQGEIVAMLGDGVNDAAALKRADVGVAMGLRGTDVAREASSVILQDDRFPTIGAAITEGRVIFDNIRHFVFYLFSCNVAEVLVILVASLIGLPQPLLPLQILWLNLVTDTFPALSLAVEPGGPDVMERPPRRPQDNLLSRGFMLSIGFFAALITGAALGAYLWTLGSGGSTELARTVAFMTLAFAQLFHLINARSDHAVIGRRGPPRNPWGWAAAGIVTLLQVATATFEPLRELLGLVPLGGRDWLGILLFAMIPAVIGQIARALEREDRVSDTGLTGAR